MSFGGPKDRSFDDGLYPVILAVGDLVLVRRGIWSSGPRDTVHGYERGAIAAVRWIQNEEMRRKGRSPTLAYDVRITGTGQLSTYVKPSTVRRDNDILEAMAEATDGL